MSDHSVTVPMSNLLVTVGIRRDVRCPGCHRVRSSRHSTGFAGDRIHSFLGGSEVDNQAAEDINKLADGINETVTRRSYFPVRTSQVRKDPAWQAAQLRGLKSAMCRNVRLATIRAKTSKGDMTIQQYRRLCRQVQPRLCGCCSAIIVPLLGRQYYGIEDRWGGVAAALSC